MTSPNFHDVGETSLPRRNFRDATVTARKFQPGGRRAYDDPRSAARLPWTSYETRVLVLCQEGYASSLAAATLVRLGLNRATDIVGGLRAWREAGLPLAERVAA